MVMLTTESVSGPADPRLDPFRNIKGQSRRTDGTFVAECELVLERLFASRIAVRSILLTPARAERLTPSLTRFCFAPNGEQAIAVFVAEQSVLDMWSDIHFTAA